MKVSWTQTYGNDRKDLVTYQMKDEKLVRFKNMLDLNLYSFHNCNDAVVNHFWNVNRLKDIKVFRFNDCSYTECVRQIVKYLNGILCDFLFFAQDDALSIEQIDYKLLLGSIKEGDYVSLGYQRSDFESVPMNYDGLFYTYTSQSFYYEGFWALDDSPYLADFNVVKNIYDETYLSQPNIWKAEMYLANRYYKEALKKKVLDKKAFQNINTVGPYGKVNPNKGVICGDEALKMIEERYGNNCNASN